MKIVVLDGYTENPGDISWAPIEALGEVTVYDRTAYEESPLIAERIGDTVEMVNKIYGHLYPSKHREVADQLEKLNF